MNNCVDCNKELSTTNCKRCHSCENKRRHKLGIINLKGNRNHNFSGGKESRECFCISCDKKLNEKAFYRGDKHCKSCGAIGELNSQWINGSSYMPYSKNWTKRLRNNIHKRDNFTCQNCGITEEEYIIICSKRLSVHHIDYNKQNCQESNLITLCQKCNIQANANRDYWYAFYMYLIENKFKD